VTTTRWRLIAACALAIPCVSSGESDSAAVYHRISAERVMKVQNKDEMAERIIATAENTGGYMLSHLPEELHLKIPARNVPGFLAAIDTMGLIVSREFTTDDITMELYGLKAAIDAKQSTYEDYLHILAQADTATVYSVEKALVSLQEELDSEKGRLAKLQHQMAYADVAVYFKFKTRIAPSENLVSNFRWLNRLKISALQARFR
jgi:hypothetical protein